MNRPGAAVGSGEKMNNSAFYARLHFQDRGRVYITIAAESDYFETQRIDRAAAHSISKALLSTLLPAAYDIATRQIDSVDGLMSCQRVIPLKLPHGFLWAKRPRTCPRGAGS
jgi:hypothetical protein